jgi:hypothetical protein
MKNARRVVHLTAAIFLFILALAVPRHGWAQG